MQMSEPIRNFIHLEMLFIVTSHHEISGGDLQLVGRLEAFGFHDRPAKLELLTKRWNDVKGNIEPDWTAKRLDVSPEAVDRLVESIKAFAPNGQSPTISCEPTGNTVWDGIVVSVALDRQTWQLHLIPTDGISKTETGALRKMFRELAMLAGLTDPRDGFPQDLLNE